MEEIMRQLISIEELRTKCRLFSGNISPEKIAPIIEEAQQVDIKPQLGEAFFHSLMMGEDGLYTTLLDGGEYITIGGEKAQFEGMKKALAYYVYSRLITSQDSYLAVTGLRRGVDDTSTMADYKEKQRMIAEVREAGESYMRDCIQYIRSTELMRALFCRDQKTTRRKQLITIL